MENRTFKRRKKNRSRSKDKEDILGNNRKIDDVRWLCSLSESELDFLISLKILILRRAGVIGHESLAEKFDLKMLRVLSFTLMEHFKEQIKDSADVSEPAESSACLEQSNLLRVKVNKKFEEMGVEELTGYLKELDFRGGLVENFGSAGIEEMPGFVGSMGIEEMFSEDLSL